MAEYRTDRDIAKRMRAPPARSYGGKSWTTFSDMEKEVQKIVVRKVKKEKANVT